MTRRDPGVAETIGTLSCEAGRVASDSVDVYDAAFHSGFLCRRTMKRRTELDGNVGFAPRGAWKGFAGEA